MTDTDVLELAAKAAEIQSRWYCGQLVKIGSNGLDVGAWNPLTDDGDAMRLAVKLRFNVTYLPTDADTPGRPHGALVTPFSLYSVYWPQEKKWVIEYNKDEYAATRCAIVRAAAEIGKEMK